MIYENMVWTNSLAFKIMEQIRKGKSITLKQEEIMLKHNVPKWYIESCKKIKYMFPKAHATAYVKMAWCIAWFKIYHPLPYYATYLSIRANAFDIEKFIAGKAPIHNFIKELKSRSKSKNTKLTTKENEMIPVLEIIEELYARGFKILPVDIKDSMALMWKIDNDKKVLIPPFIVIDGLGDIVAKSIVNERKKNPFSSVEDLKKRTSINKNSIQELEKIGSLNSLPKRNQLSLFD